MNPRLHCTLVQPILSLEPRQTKPCPRLLPRNERFESDHDGLPQPFRPDGRWCARVIHVTPGGSSVSRQCCLYQFSNMLCCRSYLHAHQVDASHGAKRLDDNAILGRCMNPRRKGSRLLTIRIGKTLSYVFMGLFVVEAMNGMGMHEAHIPPSVLLKQMKVSQYFYTVCTAFH